MTVIRLEENYVKLYSLGKEIEYRGNEIIYDDHTITFLFFYYPHLTRLYIINGVEKINNLVQVKEKINKICIMDNKAARRMREFINDKGKELYYFPPLFFREINVFINKKKYLYMINSLFDKYKEDIKNGINYPNK